MSTLATTPFSLRSACRKRRLVRTMRDAGVASTLVTAAALLLVVCS